MGNIVISIIWFFILLIMIPVCVFLAVICTCTISRRITTLLT